MRSGPLGDRSELFASAFVEFEDASNHPLKLKYWILFAPKEMLYLLASGTLVFVATTSEGNLRKPILPQPSIHLSTLHAVFMLLAGYSRTPPAMLTNTMLETIQSSSHRERVVAFGSCLQVPAGLTGTVSRCTDQSQIASVIHCNTREQKLRKNACYCIHQALRFQEALWVSGDQAIHLSQT